MALSALGAAALIAANGNASLLSLLMSVDRVRETSCLPTSTICES